MTQTTTLSQTSGFTMSRALGATALALGIMLGILGTTQSAQATVLDPIKVYAAEAQAPETSLVEANFKREHGFRKHGFKGGHRFFGKGFKRGHDFHGRGFKYGHGFRSRHGFKKFGFGHSRGFKGFGFKGHGFRRY